MGYHTVLLAAAFLLGTHAAVVPNSAGLAVSAPAGTVKGMHVANNTVRAFLGVPFADTTGGDNRFALPKPRPAKLNNFNATTLGFACPGAGGGSAIAPERIPESEDCLNLNIWAPSISRSRGRPLAPVLLWIYGGAFMAGSNAMRGYNGEFLVRDQDDIVVVVINYRTNLFGFPASPDIDAKQRNLGLFDQRFAIEWVVKNIAAFGGHPGKITLFGESAGGISIGWYPYAYPKNPLVRGVIAESGNEFGPGSPPTESNTANWNAIASGVGCTDPANQLACVKRAPLANLTAIVAQLYRNPGPAPFVPIADNVTAFTRDDTQRRFLEGSVAPLPLLVGNNRNEGELLMSLLPPGTNATPALFTFNEFTCTTALSATLRSGKGIPTWRYFYSGTYPGLDFTYPLSRFGAYHTSEIKLVFGSYNVTSPGSTMGPVTPEMVQTSDTMMAAWVAFAQNPTSGLESFGWPKYEEGKTTLVHIGKNNAGTVVFEESELNDQGPLGSCADLFPVLEKGN
ncbi:hypothetical protein HK104_000102 [Borealophlyctis nickersoniae]|nr:hypothetical protein HK104_000102 [Borealophlyctis nickersoniae]